MYVDICEVDTVATGKNIEALMKSKKHTVADLAELTGLTQGAIRNYIVGRNTPKLQNLGMIAEVYKVDIAKIVVFKKGIEEWQTHYKNNLKGWS